MGWQMKLRWLALSLLGMSMGLFAAIDSFGFETDAQRSQFRSLSEELLCPKCQNQNLAGSNSAIALDLRRELHRMVLMGQSTEQIKSFMVERYGQFVLYKPSLNSLSYVLWYGPFVLLIAGFAVVLTLSRRKVKKQTKESAQSSLDNSATRDHQQQIKALLDKKHD